MTSLRGERPPVSRSDDGAGRAPTPSTGGAARLAAGASLLVLVAGCTADPPPAPCSCIDGRFAIAVDDPGVLLSDVEVLGSATCRAVTLGCMGPQPGDSRRCRFLVGILPPGAPADDHCVVRVAVPWLASPLQTTIGWHAVELPCCRSFTFDHLIEVRRPNPDGGAFDGG